MDEEARPAGAVSVAGFEDPRYWLRTAEQGAVPLDTITGAGARFLARQPSG